jgi:hypothetical protein
VLNKTILRRSLLGVSGAAVALAVVWLGMRALAAPVMHLADADDNTEVELGKHSYGLYWASCHGRALQGQSLWQLNDKDAGRRAPAHDASGHTSQHSDEALFQITKYGRFASMPGGPSRIPAFKDRLTDDQILAIIAFPPACRETLARAGSTLGPGPGSWLTAATGHGVSPGRRCFPCGSRRPLGRLNTSQR